MYDFPHRTLLLPEKSEKRQPRSSQKKVGETTRQPTKQTLLPLRARLCLQQHSKSQREKGRGTHAVDGEHRDGTASDTVDGDDGRGAHCTTGRNRGVNRSRTGGHGGVDGVDGINGVGWVHGVHGPGFGGTCLLAMVGGVFGQPFC